MNTTTETTPADFDGYLALAQVEGHPPFLYRLDRIKVGRDTPTACEDCGAMQAASDPTTPFYRWIELHETGYPLHFGVCHTCLTDTYWAKRFADNEVASGEGDRMHIYSPIDPVTRDRNAR